MDIITKYDCIQIGYYNHTYLKFNKQILYSNVNLTFHIQPINIKKNMENNEIIFLNNQIIV